ncbi:hypothetical protein Q5752_005581 [Cryptotrichosporon argae]
MDKVSTVSLDHARITPGNGFPDLMGRSENAPAAAGPSLEKNESTASSLPLNPPLSFAPHTAPSDRVLGALDTGAEHGLAEAEAARRLERYGANRLKPPKRANAWKIVVRQVGNAMTVVLIAAMAVSFGTQDFISGGVIASLVALNISIVASLESVGAPSATVIRASGTSPVTKTIPVDEVVPGDIALIKNGDIVPADGRMLEGWHSNLECDEAFLTGESLPVAKSSDAIDDDNAPVGDRTSMVYAGSQVTKGHARVVVTATAMQTEIGKIAHALEAKAGCDKSGWQKWWWKIKVALGVEETSPLQIKLNKLAYILLGAACVIAVVVVASTGFRNVPLSVATYAVAAAVSILPASLIAVVSLTLATASTDLAKRNALVRRMDAIEALAGVENVCSDKTGTLTVGRMVARTLWVPRRDAGPDAAEINTRRGQAYSFEAGSDPFYPRGEVTADLAELTGKREPLDLRTRSLTRNGRAKALSQDEVDAQDTVVHPDQLPEGLRELALCAALCNQATLARPAGDEGQWEANGDPTEIALQVAAHKLGRGKPFLTHSRKHELQRTTSAMAHHRPALAALGGHYEQIIEHPFDSTVKRMSIAYRFVPDGSDGDGSDAHVYCFLKGAVERVLEGCTSVGQGDRALDDEAEADILRKMDALASQGLRVLALSSKRLPASAAGALAQLPRAEFERGFAFAGLAGIYDPPRKESAGAVADCLRAGITPRMLTGDHPATATAIARSIGILDRTSADSMVMTGQQFDKLTEAEIDALDELPLVVARCAPETKVRMVDAIHRRKQHTVMTGDGVNDSPALKRADVGVGMGTGSDVAKQSSNLVLADDNFATICRAIRKGRSVFKNLSKFLLYLLSGNLAEIIVMLVGLAFQDGSSHAVFPLSPVAALWINTLSAGPPALALGLEPTARDAMELAPSAFHHLFKPEFYADLLFYGTLMAALSLANFAIVLWGYFPGDLGLNCNETAGRAGCDPVFQARSTCFATLVIILMIHALECKHSTTSLFRLDVGDNRVLLWCAVSLTLLTFPVVYIPRINDAVFLIGPLKWEWGIVFGMILVYLAVTELYKYAKRVYFRHRRPQEPKRVPADKTLRMENTIAMA